MSDPLRVLRELGGYYQCPKDADGKRLGPLVGYAGRDAKGRQYVGDIYANFAKAEQYPEVLDKWATSLYANMPFANVCLGMPMGGILFADALARKNRCRIAFLEKKILQLATHESRERSELVFGRHDLQEDDQVILVEDVVNNFSTTGDAIRVVSGAGATVVAIAAILNRSGKRAYQPAGFVEVPVIALVTADFPQYSQDDPAVVEDVQAGNIVWKPKAEWERLPPPGPYVPSRLEQEMIELMPILLAARPKN